MMKINNIDVTAKEFAYDGCHKIYLIEDEMDRKEADRMSYNILPIEELPNTFADSCPYRFIDNWKLNKYYVKQCEDATFEYDNRILQVKSYQKAV